MSHSARGSNVRTTANINVSAPKANSEASGITRARLTILTIVTSTPSMNTSIIPHGRTNWIARSTRLKPGGTKPARTGTSTYSSEISSTSGNRVVETKTMVATICMSSFHSATIAPNSVVCDVRPLASSSTIGKPCAIRKVISAASVIAQIPSSLADALRYSVAPQRGQRATERALIRGLRNNASHSWHAIRLAGSIRFHATGERRRRSTRATLTHRRAACKFSGAILPNALARGTRSVAGRPDGAGAGGRRISRCPCPGLPVE